MKRLKLNIPHPVPNFYRQQPSPQLCQVQLLPYSLVGRQAQGTNTPEFQSMIVLFIRHFLFIHLRTKVNDQTQTPAQREVGANFNGKFRDTESQGQTHLSYRKFAESTWCDFDTHIFTVLNLISKVGSDLI